MEIFRQSRAYGAVAEDAAAGTLSHAYLLLCPDAKNLRSFLKELAACIACAGMNGTGRARAARLIAAERYADCRVFPAEGERCGVDEVRSLLADCIVKPVEAPRKVFVLDAVQNMLEAAQNKLLKVLEEPPENVHFVLGATSAAAVLPTVLSRVKKLELLAFPTEAIERYLQQAFPSREGCHEAALLSGGVLGRAEELLAEGGGMLEAAAEMALTLSPAGIPAMARSVSGRAQAAALLEALRLVFRDMLMLRLGHGELLTGGKAAEAVRRAAPRYTVAGLLAAEDAVGRAERSLRGNAQPVICLETLLYGILEGR